MKPTACLCMSATVFKNTVSKDLAKRFSMECVHSEENTDDIPDVNVAQMANVLDPKYKNLKFETSERIYLRIHSIVCSKILSVNSMPTTIGSNIQIKKPTV